MKKNYDSERIVEILNAFKVGVERIEAHHGPATTLYEIQPELGVRISKIRNLKDEIAVGLQSDNVRIIAPIPGKGTVGIEVPNKVREILPIEDILTSKEYEQSDMELPCALGRTVTNDILMADLAKMPHLLIAGATGQGKSVGLNTILMSLMTERTPDEMKLVLVDPKQVEFGIYSPLVKNYLALPILTEAQSVQGMLNTVVFEMEMRYTKLSAKGVRNVKEYNDSVSKEERMPYIVVVIDEYGDLVMQAGKDMEKLICRIAQKARAVGIHMIISTQRPSVKIVTGDIKANFPTRIAFRTTTSTDSKVVLGKKGAESLTGKGDMLFFNGEGTVRAQCANTSTEDVLHFISETCERYSDYRNGFQFEALRLLEEQRKAKEEEAKRKAEEKAKYEEKRKAAREAWSAKLAAMPTGDEKRIARATHDEYGWPSFYSKYVVLSDGLMHSVTAPDWDECYGPEAFRENEILY